MHSIAELKRQLDQSRAREAEARIARQDAETRVTDALCAEMLEKFKAMGGEIGVTRVRVAKWAYFGEDAKPDMSRGPFVVMGAKRGIFGLSVQYVLRKLKKDGTPSAAPSGCDTDTVFILPEDQPAKN